MTRVRGRFAPSPTGLMHLGNARSALLGWLHARAAGGEFHLRIEDLDAGRCKPEYVDALKRDLEWLGLDWDGPVLVQSERALLYREALGVLDAKGLTFFCTCSRADLARAASAPHEGEDGPLYPGTCRQGPTKARHPASVRFRAQGGPTSFVDLLHGPYTQDVARAVGDFVIRRADGIAAYQLAVVVDDAQSGITHVLRGDDLLSSTPRQLQLYAALEQPAPQFAHLPLLLDEHGKRMAKRDGSSTVAYFRERGLGPERLLGLMAKWSGLTDGAPITARELVPGFSLGRVSREPAVVRDSLT
ncbi:MAG: tRNA glutamyl-Q(34) synthetase GluQRS [Archangiaceae bacterium]|nr:tRNA glutamyl-Q(34) synthetase GluQRS [Archangiaceae bacterium]